MCVVLSAVAILLDFYVPFFLDVLVPLNRGRNASSFSCVLLIYGLSLSPSACVCVRTIFGSQIFRCLVFRLGPATPHAHNNRWSINRTHTYFSSLCTCKIWFMRDDLIESLAQTMTKTKNVEINWIWWARMALASTSMIIMIIETSSSSHTHTHTHFLSALSHWQVGLPFIRSIWHVLVISNASRMQIKILNKITRHPVDLSVWHAVSRTPQASDSKLVQHTHHTHQKHIDRHQRLVKLREYRKEITATADAVRQWNEHQRHPW